MYDLIGEISLGSVPKSIVSKFEGLESDSRAFLSEVSCFIRKAVASDLLSNRSDSESVSSAASALVASKSHQQSTHNALPNVEPKVFSGDTVKYKRWLN